MIHECFLNRLNTFPIFPCTSIYIQNTLSDSQVSDSKRAVAQPYPSPYAWIWIVIDVDNIQTNVVFTYLLDLVKVTFHYY